MSFLTAVFLFFPNPDIGITTNPAQSFEVTAPVPHVGTFDPVITAPAVFISDNASGGKIWEKNGSDQRAMASLTKLMTALIIVENHDFAEVVTVPQEAISIGGASMKLQLGEQITVGNLLKGLMIPSGNDAAVTLALHHAASEAEFVAEMNQRAYFLGMKNTNFKNVHGYDEEGHFSTAADLTILARKVLEFPALRQMGTTALDTATSVDGNIVHELRSTNDLLRSPFPVYGLKTGTTDEAGQCLITLLRSGGHEILVVVLGSENRFADTKALLWPFL